MSKEYFITIKGQRIPVSEEVYFAYKRPAWRERKRRQAWNDREISLDALMEFDMDLGDPIAMLAYEVVEDQIVLDTLMAVLSEKERALIQALIIDRKTEQAVADETGIPRKTISNRKKRLLEKMRKFLC
jgi:RNA polymerase sigma factor (sigma-70 family)